MRRPTTSLGGFDGGRHLARKFGGYGGGGEFLSPRGLLVVDGTLFWLLREAPPASAAEAEIESRWGGRGRARVHLRAAVRGTSATVGTAE
mmetsp:Transcript_63333/g.187170  ORF Transcript_63333/g.187170 Transcript_63333/m.187170 type:complete len:90 (-) Transcript_63333:578-847(-)